MTDKCDRGLFQVTIPSFSEGTGEAMKACNHSLRFGASEGEVGPVFEQALIPATDEREWSASNSTRISPEEIFAAPELGWTVCKEKISCPCRE